MQVSTPSKWKTLLHDALLAFGIYFGTMIVVGAAMFLFPLELRNRLWWLAPALGLLVVSFIWGRTCDKHNLWLVSILAMRPGADAYESVKSFPMNLLAAIGMCSTIGIGLGLGVLSKRLGSRRIIEGNNE